MADLERLADIARQDREDFFYRQPEWAKFYRDRILCVALCQGAAQHYIDSTTGINDFDVYTFYEAHTQKAWYAKRIKSYDFGDPKFGKSKDRPDFIGRRVDCLGRSLTLFGDEGVETALRRYLREQKTETYRLLSYKAVVLLNRCAEKLFGRKTYSHTSNLIVQTLAIPGGGFVFYRRSSPRLDLGDKSTLQPVEFASLQFLAPSPISPTYARI